MARPSKIDQLPNDIRNLIGILRQGGATIDQIRAKLQEMLPPDQVPGRSGLGEHVKEYDAFLAMIKQQREVVGSLVADLGDGPGSADKMARFNGELLEAMTSKLMAEAARSGDPVDPGFLKMMAQIKKNLAQAAKFQMDAANAHEEWRRQHEAERNAQIKAAAAAAEDEAKGKGFSDEQAAFIRAKILGVQVDNGDAR